jgi:hypothetical protein
MRIEQHVRVQQQLIACTQTSSCTPPRLLPTQPHTNFKCYLKAPTWIQTYPAAAALVECMSVALLPPSEATPCLACVRVYRQMRVPQTPLPQQAVVPYLWWPCFIPTATPTTNRDGTNLYTRILCCRITNCVPAYLTANRIAAATLVADVLLKHTL